MINFFASCLCVLWGCGLLVCTPGCLCPKEEPDTSETSSTDDTPVPYNNTLGYGDPYRFGKYISSGTKFREPFKKIEYYYFDLFYTEKDTKYFTFKWDLRSMNYSLITPSQSKSIAKDIYYVKTFGGTVPTVSIVVIDGRLIIFPETIKDSMDESEIFRPMKAVTHIYDIRTGKTVESEPYIYDHNVPLKYDFYGGGAL